MEPVFKARPTKVIIQSGLLATALHRSLGSSLNCCWKSSPPVVSDQECSKGKMPSPSIRGPNLTIAHEGREESLINK